MFCTKCGKQISDGNKFCDQCGAPVETDGAAETAAAAEAAESEQPSEIAETVPESYYNVPPQRGTGKFKKVIAAVAAVAAVVCITAAAAPYVSNFAFKTFMPAAKYYRHIETKSIKDGIAGISNGADEIGGDSNSVSGKLELELKNTDLLESIGDVSDVFDVIGDAKSAAISFDAKMKNNIFGFKGSGKVNNTEIADVECIADSKSGDIYFGIPTLSKKYLSGSMDSANIDFEDAFGFSKAIPDGKTVSKLLNTYVSTVVNGVKKVDKSKETVNIGEISANYTVLNVNIDGETAASVARAVCLKAKDDKELKKLITDIAGAVEESSGTDPESVLEEFEDGLDDVIDNISDDDMDLNIKYKVYVDGKGNIVGRSIKSDDFGFSYICAQKGGKYAFEAAARADGMKVASIEGNGKKSSDRFTGDVSVEVYGQEIVEMSLKNFVYDIKNCRCKGSGTIKMSDSVQALRNLGLDSDILEFLSSVSLRFKLDSSLSKNDTELSFCSGNDVIASLKMSVKDSSRYNPSVPSSSIDINDSDKMEEYADSVDFGKIVDNLEKAGVSNDICDELRDNLPA